MTLSYCSLCRGFGKAAIADKDALDRLRKAYIKEMKDMGGNTLKRKSDKLWMMAKNELYGNVSWNETTLLGLSKDWSRYCGLGHY